MRRALLAGIPAFRRKEIPALPVIRRDLVLLEETLHRSGYEDVRVRGASQESDLSEGTRNEIAYEIDRLCRDADEGDTLLVYLSSHGVHYDGRDYLVPSDAWWRDPRDFPKHLLPIDFAAYADESRADTMVVFIDACREGVDIGVKAVGATLWSQGQRDKARKRHLVLCFACQPGEYARYVPGEQGFSLFARALATVLDAGHPAQTLRQVCEAAQEALDALARAHDKPRQHLRTAVEMEIAGESALDRTICEGAGMSRLTTAAHNPWTQAALGAELWHREELGRCAWLPELRKAVACIVDACWEVFAARPDAASDPWTDAALPGRVVDALGLLGLRSEPAIALNAGETALAVIAPFAHEATLLAATAGELERAIENSRRAYPQLARKEARLVELGRAGDAAAIRAWLVHKARFRLPTATLPPAVALAIAEAVAEVCESPGLDAGTSRIVAETLRAERIFALSRCVIAEPTAVQRDDRPGSLGHDVPAGGFGHERRIREKLLGYLLVVAGRLALDARMLSDVMVEHLGLSDPVDPAQVLDVAGRAIWRPTRVGLVLSGQCTHPAVDLALREHVRELGADLELIHRMLPGGREALAPLQALPVRAAADELGPAPGRGYELPHVSFHLATNEVQELLMGEQLYGDPTLAIRELYQNALDACRYRQARQTYLQRTGQMDRDAGAWQGRIVFRQGVHEGRPYIECQDNGIGMDRRVIAECFARAGRRFHDSPEFIEEQIEWQRCEPPVEMFPNSQFGIGVFSYFMLADELEVETCRLDRSGRPGETLRVRIAGSGSLFRIVPARVPMRDAGTRVRLYLQTTEHKGRKVSCYHTLRRELWVAEFETETIEDEKRFVWRPGELAHPRLKAREILATRSPHLWWVMRGSARRAKVEISSVLADGLVIDNLCPGVIVNLVGKHRPRLTVDRRRALEIDHAYVRELAAANIDSLLEWKALEYEWMWMLANEVSVQVAEALTSQLVARNAALRCHSLEIEDPIPISMVGCFPPDASYLSGVMIEYPRWKWLYRHRATAWWRAAERLQLNKRLKEYMGRYIVRTVRDVESAVEIPETLLCATPVDAVLVSTNLNCKEPWIGDSVPTQHIQRAAEKTGLSTDEVIARLQKFVPFGLKLPT